MTTNEWIERINKLRDENTALAHGKWHGYGNEGEVIRGQWILIRWKLPGVAVAHDDPDEAIRLAVRIENLLSGTQIADRPSEAERRYHRSEAPYREDDQE